MAFEAHGSVQGAPVEQTPTPKTVETPAAPAAPETPKTPAQAAPAEALATASEFSPDFKLKILGKEFEVPEMFRGLVKDEETQKQVREIFEKAYGLDEAKPKYEQSKTENVQLRETLQTVQSDINELKGYYNAGDLDSFFQKLNVPMEKVLHWLQEKANYQELPPEQRQIVDARKAAIAQARQLELQNQELTAQSHQQQVQALGYMLNLTLEKPEVKTFEEKFDSLQGGQGAFRQAVIEYGQMAYALNGKMVLPDEAVKAVMERFSPFLASQQAAPAVVPVAQAAPPTQEARKGLPNIQSRASATASKPKPKSLDDLRAIHKKMAGF
jgi:hypothetical protein